MYALYTRMYDDVHTDLHNVDTIYRWRQKYTVYMGAQFCSSAWKKSVSPWKNGIIPEYLAHFIWH